MQTLVCTVCDQTWEREPKRGRPPVRCPSCADNNSVAPSKPRNTEPKGKTTDKWATFSTAQQVEFSELPLSERASGWCTDYDPLPKAVHERCDGNLGKRRCKCPEDCHGWN